MKVAMLLLAAGRGARFGGPLPKAYLPLAGEPLLLRSARRLAQVAELSRGGDGELIVVVHDDDRERHLAPLLPALRSLGDVKLASGGASRQESMRNGLAAASTVCEVVLVHDAARPLFPVAAARACIAAAAREGAALLAVPVADTLKIVRGERVERTLDRAGVWAAQTPQALRRDVLQRALARAAADGFDGTDDVSLAEHAGVAAVVVRGAPSNVKITAPEDLAFAEALLAGEER